MLWTAFLPIALATGQSGILYSAWLILAGAAVLISIIGALALMGSHENVTPVMITAMFIGFGLALITAILSGNIEFLDATGTPHQYTDMAWTLFPFYGIALLDFVFALVGIVLAFRQFKFKRGY